MIRVTSQGRTFSADGGQSLSEASQAVCACARIVWIACLVRVIVSGVGSLLGEDQGASTIEGVSHSILLSHRPGDSTSADSDPMVHGSARRRHGYHASSVTGLGIGLHTFFQLSEQEPRVGVSGPLRLGLSVDRRRERCASKLSP